MQQELDPEPQLSYVTQEPGYYCLSTPQMQYDSIIAAGLSPLAKESLSSFRTKASAHPPG